MLAVIVEATENRHLVGILFAFYIMAVLIITLLVRTYDVEVKTLYNPISKYETLGKEFAEYGL